MKGVKKDIFASSATQYPVGVVPTYPPPGKKVGDGKLIK